MFAVLVCSCFGLFGLLCGLDCWVGWVSCAVFWGLGSVECFVWSVMYVLGFGCFLVVLVWGSFG